MDRLDKSIRSGYLQMKKDGSKQGRGKCPDDEAMALYVQGVLRGSKKERIIRHLLRCEDCLQDVIYLKGWLEGRGGFETLPYLEIPEGLVKEAMSIIPKENKPDILKIIINLTKDSIRLIKTYGDLVNPVRMFGRGFRPHPNHCSESLHSPPDGSKWLSNGVNILPPLPEPVRGKERDGLEEIIPITKTFEECQVKVEIERLPDQFSCRIKLKVMDKIGDSPLGDIRVSLFDSDRELESYCPEKGEVIFDNLSPKDYRIEIMQGWNKMGEVEIKIM